jgi:hypothetical protein
MFVVGLELGTRMSLFPRPSNNRRSPPRRKACGGGRRARREELSRVRHAHPANDRFFIVCPKSRGDGESRFTVVFPVNRKVAVSDSAQTTRALHRSVGMITSAW